MTRIGADAREDDEREPRRLEARVEPPEDAPGSCRYVAIEYVIRDAPMTPAFVAMKRIVAARMPT